MGLKAKTGSHLPVLIKALSLTDGDVLEMGMGFFSTPFLHWACLNRKLVSYESEPKYYWKFHEGFDTPNHGLFLIDDWDKAEIDRPWDVVLIDHAPSERRSIDTMRVANLAKYIILHDTDAWQDKHYHYREILPLFKYCYRHAVCSCHTTVVSNLVDLTEFSV